VWLSSPATTLVIFVAVLAGLAIRVLTEWPFPLALLVGLVFAVGLATMLSPLTDRLDRALHRMSGRKRR
jgi:NhaP-type Na+/H+ or K+/H+ antiporter